jgi:hypothetical protein
LFSLSSSPPPSPATHPQPQKEEKNKRNPSSKQLPPNYRRALLSSSTISSSQALQDTLSSQNPLKWRTPSSLPSRTVWALTQQQQSTILLNATNPLFLRNVRKDGTPQSLFSRNCEYGTQSLFATL